MNISRTPPANSATHTACTHLCSAHHTAVEVRCCLHPLEPLAPVVLYKKIFPSRERELNRYVCAYVEVSIRLIRKHKDEHCPLNVTDLVTFPASVYRFIHKIIGKVWTVQRKSLFSNHALTGNMLSELWKQCIHCYKPWIYCKFTVCPEN